MQLFRKFQKQCWLVLGLAFFALNANASLNAPQEGVEFRTLAKAQPTETNSPKKIEIIEFFGYFCPHCNAMEPFIAAWAKKHADEIVFKRVHVDFHELVTQQKLFYTIEAMGKIEEFHAKAFTAFHVERNRLMTDADVMAFVGKSGLDKKKFSDIYNSAFTMNNKLNRTKQLMSTYGIDSVPTFVVDGHYITAPTMAAKSLGRVSEEQQNQAAVQMLDWLLAKAQKEKGITPAPAKAK